MGFENFDASRTEENQQGLPREQGQAESEIEIGRKLDALERAVADQVEEYVEKHGVDNTIESKAALHVWIRETLWREGCRVFGLDPKMDPWRTD